MKNTLMLSIAMLLAQVYAYAVDGQVLINQSTLNAAGGTYTITQPGSYKLSGNLTAKNQDTDVIVINADFVTLDLNGFTILGTADCSGGFPCIGRGNGRGIVSLTNRFNITIRNGIIQGMGNSGISLNGDSILVEYMHVRGNGSSGIAIQRLVDPQITSIVQHNTVVQNGGEGIFVLSGIVADNVVSENRLDGILFFNFDSNGPRPAGTAARNVVRRNQGVGLDINQNSSVNYIGNVFSENGNTVIGGINQGQNLCGTSTCPGATF